MNMDSFSQPLQHSLGQSEQIAVSNDSPSITVEHWLMAAFQAGGGAREFLQKLGLRTGSFLTALQGVVKDLPRMAKSNGEAHIQRDLSRMLNIAAKIAKSVNQSDVIGEEHLAAAILLDGELSASKLLREHGASALKESVNAELTRILGANGEAAEGASALKKYAVDLTARAENNELDPVIGRDKEIRATMQTLARRTKNNPILIGQPGVGKTAV